MYMQTFSLKGQMVNILGFLNYTASAVTTQLCLWGWKKLLLLFPCQGVSDFLWLHGLQYARLPCPSLSPEISSDSFPWSWWCHPTISASVAPFSWGPQSFSGDSALCIWCQNIGASALASVLSMNIQGWFSLGLTGLISLPSKGLLRVFFSTTVWKHQFVSI